MLPYRKCHTWELSDKTVGLDIRDETGCCMTAAAFCRISAREAAGSGSASCQYGPLSGPFIPVSAPCEFLAAAAETGAAAAKPAALAAEAGFYSSAEQVGTLFETACAALEPATVGIHTSSAPVAAFRSSAGDGTAAHPAAGVIRGSAAQLSVAVSAADGSRGSHSKRCHPLLRKHRSLDSWFTSALPACPATRETRSQHDVVASSAGDTPAAVTVTHSTNVVDRDTRVQTFPVVTGTKCRLAAPEGTPAATAAWGAATKSATATGATCTPAGGASAAGRAAAAGPESAAGETTETDASAATALTSKNSTILRRPHDGSSGSSCTQKRTSSCSPPDVSSGEKRRGVSNTDNCQGEQHDRLPGGGDASRTSQEASSVAEGVAADIGNRADSGALLPLLQQRRPQLSSRSQSAAACALPAGHVAAPPCSSAAVVLSTQATAPLSGEVATTTALSAATAPALPAATPALPAAAPALPAAAPALPAAAPALPTEAPALAAAAPALPAAVAAGEGESCTLREAIATAERDGINSVKCVAGPGGVTAADEELGDSSSNDSSSGPPSRTSSFSRRADSAASVGSDGLDLLSDEEQNKLNLFRSIGMMVPVAGGKKGKQHSAKKRSGSSSAPAAYDSFASTCPHSLSFVSSHSFSLPYSSSGGVLRPMEAAANEDWWGSSSEDDGSGISIRIRSRRISELHEIAVKSRLRSATYPTFKIPKEQQQEQQPEEHEPEQQEDGRACRTQSARLSRSARTSTCQSAVNVLQCKEQRQQGQKDVRLRQRLQQQEEANQQQYEDCSSTTIERAQDVPPGKRWKVSKPRHSASQQLLCETWYKRILNSGCRSLKFSTTSPPYANVDSSGAEGINSGKHNVAGCGGSVAVAPTVIGKREGPRRTVSLADNDPGLTTSAVLSTALNVRSTIPITAVAAAALLQTEEAAGSAAAGGAALGAASAAALLEGSEATEASEGRAEHGIAGATGDGDMQAAHLARAERNLVESPAENVAETLRAAADVPRVHPSVQIPLLSFPRRLDSRERAPSECYSVSPAWEHDTGSGVSCGTATARDGSQTPLAAADRACSAGEVFIDQSVASSQQFEAATSEAADVPVLHSSTADSRGETPAKVNDAALATNEGSDTRTGVDAESVNFSGSGTSGGSRSSSSLAPGGFTSVPTSGTEIPVIQLFAAKDEGEGRAAGEPGAESRIHQAAGVSDSPATAVTSKESVRVSASLPERRPPSPSISRFEAAATGDEGVSRCASEEGDSTAGVSTTRRMAPGCGLSRRSSGELLGPAEGRGEGFYGGHYSKKTAAAGTTSLMYGRYLGVTDISTGQSTASPSTVSTVSPYSCSGFSSSYSLPSSSTSVLGSQLCASAAATLVSPSPTDTPLEDAFFTASSSPSAAAGLGSSFTPSSAEDSLSFSSCPSPIPSYENRASSPTPPTNEAAGEAATESAAVGAGTPNASRSAKASVPRSTSLGKHAGAMGADHAAPAVAGWRNFPVSAKFTVSGGATAEAGERGGAPDVFGSGARKTAASTRSALLGAPAAGAAREGLQGVTECAPLALAGRANNGVSEGEPKEGGARQRSAWKVSVRKMFSSKGLLRWKSAVTAVVCKPPGAAHQDVNRDQAAAPEKQEPLPHDAEAAAAHRHLLCHPRGLSPAAFEPVSAPATTSGWSRATGTAAPCRTYTTEKPPREEELPMRTCMEVANKLQRTGSSSVDNAEEGIISERFTALSAQRALVQQQQKRERQVEPHEEVRQEFYSGEQQKGRQSRKVSYRCQDEQQQLWQQPEQRNREQQLRLQPRREDDRREEYVCRERTADKVKVHGSHTQVEDGGGRGEIRAGGGDEAIDRIKEKYVSASSGWLPLSHLRDGDNLHSGESQHSRERQEETRQQEEKQQLRNRVVVTEQTKERTHVGQSPSQVLKRRCRSHVPETEERLPGDAHGQYKIRAELHQQLRLGVKQQQERPREVAEICRQDGGYQGRLQTRQEACRRETIETALNCRDERLHQKVADGERLQQQRRTQPLQREQLEVTQQWDRARDSDDRRLAEKRVLPDEGGGLTHLVGGPLGGLSVEASKRSDDLFHGTEKCYVPVLSSSWSSPVPLFPPYARSMSSGSSLGHARTLLPSAARSLDWSYCQRPAHHVAAAAAMPKEHANAPKHFSAFGRPVAGEAGEVKKHGGAPAAHAVYTTDGTALPALLAIAGPADAARATTTRAAAEAPGAEGSGQLPAVETAGQLLGRHSTGLTRRVGDTCAAAPPAERSRSGCVDLCLSSATKDVALPARDAGSPGASFCRMRAPSRAFGETENASCRGLSESHQDLQQKLLFLEYRRSDRFGSSMEYDTAERRQQLRRSISLAGTTLSHHPLWRTSRDGDFGVARSEGAAAGRSTCSRCAAVGMNAEPHMRASQPESTTGAAVATVSTTAAAGGPAAWTATAESAVYSTLSTAALGQARSSSATTTAPPVGDDMHGAVGEDIGTGGPPAGGTTQCEALPEVKTLKREKELTALAFIRDHLNTLTPRRRDQRGETRRGERCCVTATGCERSQCGRDEYRAQSSCIPGGGDVRDPPCTVDDDSADVDAAVSPCAHHDTERADEADVSTTTIETHALISEHAAAYHLAGPEGPGSISSERDASRFYLSDARRSWPQIAVAGFSILKGSGATAETQQPVETPCAPPGSGQQATPQTSGRRETTLEHHIRRFLQLWADGEQVPGNSSSDSLRLGTGSGTESRKTEEQQQQQNRVAERGEIADEERDTTAQRSPQREGAGAASQASLMRQCPSEERSAVGAGTSSCGPYLLSDFGVARSRPAVGSRMCSGGNSEGSSHPSVSAHTGARNEVGALPQEAQLIRRYQSENATGPLATRLRLRKCAGETAADVSVAGETWARRLCRAGSAPAAEVLTTRSDAAAIFPAKFRTSTGCSSAVAISILPSAAIPDSSSAAAHASGFACGAGNAAAAFPRTADHAVCGSHFLSGGNAVCRGWSLDVSADSPRAAPEMVGTFVSTGGTLVGQSGQTATRRSRTAASLSASAAKSAFDQPTANASRAPRAAEAEITDREKEGSALSRAGLSDSVNGTAAGEDGVTETSIQRNSRDSHGCRLVMQPQRLEKDELHQREQLPGANLHKNGRQTNQKVPEETEAEQPWCQHPEQQLPRQKQDAAAPAENAVFSVEQVAFKEGVGQPQEETDVRDGDAHESGAASTFGAAGLQPFLMFPRKAEECYRQKLDSVFSFRLLIVGAALLLVQILHLLWGAVRRGFLWGNSHEEDTWCRIAAVGDAVQLALYVVLSLGGHIHTSRFSLETWTCGLFSLAFATRCCTLLATLFLGQGASALSFAAGDVPAAASAAQLASYSGAVSYQLVRLSLCCIFHVLLSGMMLPARTLVCLPMHAFHFGGCLVAAGAAATYTRLDLNPDGPLCALSSCLYTVLGCFCQAQLEASQRQLYVQWKNSQRGLQDMQRKRGQRSPSSGGVTGVEQVALLVRQSQVLLRDAVGGNSVHSKEGIFEQLASLQKEILEIVTGVRSIYHAQTGKEEIYELLHSMPEGHDVEPPAVGRRIREQGDSQPCRQAASNGRGCWLCPQNEPLLVKRPAESRPRGGAQAPWQRTGEAPDQVAGAAAPGGEALDAAAPQEKVVVAPGTNVEGKRPPTTTRRAEASVTDIFRDSPVETAGGRTGDWMSSCRPRRSTGSVCSHRSLFEADLEDGSVLRETVEKLQKAASDKAGGAILQEPSNGAIDLICRLGIEWDVDFFQVDEYTEGNTLRLTGEVQLSPLVRPDGLRCELRVLRRFLHSVQRQYRVTNPYHNQLHAAMVSHCCLVLVGECLPSRDALTYTDEICLCVAALTHDMGHPGLTNQYLISSQSLLATTYNDIAVLENYHAACCFRTAGHCEDLNIFAGLSQEVYSYMRQNIIGLILATDMSKHLSYISRLRVRLEAGNFNPAIGADRWLFFQACVKAADLAHLATNWEQHRRWAELLCEEFYRQGDEERRQGLPVIETFDRNMSHRFPQSQFRFIQVVVMPLIEALVDVETLLKGRGGVRTIICRHIVSNRRKWKKLAVAAGFACPAGRDGDAAGEDEEDSDEQQTTGEQSRTREECGVCKTGER